ncbi:MAG: hypothetical protein QOF73_2863, partial [Thermomicrobiales bacterium]|nr:hypothetical protein [Thermomicrobiales bacterium]
MTDPAVIQEAIRLYLDACMEYVENKRSKGVIETVLLNMAGFAWECGYERGQADLMARFVPVRFEADAVGLAELDEET